MLQNQFENYLSSLGISSKTFKNYKSDISHFLGWAVLKLKTFGSQVEELEDLVPFLSDQLAEGYLGFMTSNSIPTKTVNRRLSSLRHLSKFLVLANIVDFDFAKNLQNIGPAKRNQSLPQSIIADFISHLEAEKVSKNTIKNYASDVRQFLTWLESNHA